MPRNSRNPNTSLNVVTTTAEATAGSTPNPAQKQGHTRSHQPGDDHVAQHCQPQHQTQAQVLFPNNRDQGDQNAEPHAVQHTQYCFPGQQTPAVDTHQLAQRHRSDQESKRLCPADPALTGNDGQECGQHHDPGQGGLEEGYGNRGQEGGGQIDGEPGQACANGPEQWPIRRVASHAGYLQHLFGVLFNSCSQQEFGGDDADQSSVIHDGQLSQIVMALQPGALLTGSFHRYRGHDGRPHLSDRCIIPGQRQIRHTDLAGQSVAILENEYTGEIVRPSPARLWRLSRAAFARPSIPTIGNCATMTPRPCPSRVPPAAYLPTVGQEPGPTPEPSPPEASAVSPALPVGAPGKARRRASRCPGVFRCGRPVWGSSAATSTPRYPATRR